MDFRHAKQTEVLIMEKWNTLADFPIAERFVKGVGCSKIQRGLEIDFKAVLFLHILTASNKLLYSPRIRMMKDLVRRLLKTGKNMTISDHAS